MDFTILFIIAATIAVFVTAAFEAVKIFFNIATRYLPIAAIVVGFFVALILQPFTIFDFYTMTVAGGIAGLSACGLFDVKKVFSTYAKDGNYDKTN